MTREQQGIVLFLGLLFLIFFSLTSPNFLWAPSSERIKAESLNKVAAGKILLEVTGEVRREGIYHVPVGTPLSAVLEESGGLKGKLKVPAEVLQQKVEETRHIHISATEKGEGKVSIEPLAAPKLAVLSLPININLATAEELITLPGIGPKTAQAIIDFREKKGKFKSPEDLLQVPGLGPKKLAAIRKRITAE